MVTMIRCMRMALMKALQALDATQPLLQAYAKALRKRKVEHLLDMSRFVSKKEIIYSDSIPTLMISRCNISTQFRGYCM